MDRPNITVKDLQGFLKLKFGIKTKGAYLVEGGKRDYFEVYVDRVMGFVLKEAEDFPYINLHSIRKSPNDKPGNICIRFDSRKGLDYD